MKIVENMYVVYDNFVYTVIKIFKTNCNLNSLDGLDTFRVANLKNIRPFYLQKGDKMSISYVDLRGIHSFRGIVIKTIYTDGNRVIISFTYEDNGDTSYQDLEIFGDRNWVT